MWNEQAVGVGWGDPGPMMAAAETVRVIVTGKGGHGALPHLAVDPVLAAAQIVVGLQSIVARNVSPLETAVVTIGAIHGGEAFNVIPPSVEMKGTIRTFDPQVRTLVLERFEQMVHHTAEAFGCQALIEVNYPDAGGDQRARHYRQGTGAGGTGAAGKLPWMWMSAPWGRRTWLISCRHCPAASC